ncbi:hypothetical protein [Devosia sp. LC5]|uniref:hypothetical protein n=1 Tax=Devosia sp. LC5 TaxID=1502724 RepID=UPI0005506E20|nr:hypothetical protein [Devosia sp. LC5]
MTIIDRLRDWLRRPFVSGGYADKAPDGILGRLSDPWASQDVYVDAYLAPTNWQQLVADMGINPQRAEPQPIADQIKLHGCTNVPKELPAWLRKA